MARYGKRHQSYTSKRNLLFVKSTSSTSTQGVHTMVDCESDTDVSASRSSRSRVVPVDWSHCLFCQKNKDKSCRELLNVRSFDACQSIHFTQVQKCLKALQISCDTGCFAKKSRKVNFCHQQRIAFTTTLKGVITKHWYGSGRWRQCKPYQHLLVTDGSYKVKTWKSSTCQGNLLRRDC